MTGHTGGVTNTTVSCQMIYLSSVIKTDLTAPLSGQKEQYSQLQWMRGGLLFCTFLLNSFVHLQLNGLELKLAKK